MDTNLIALVGNKGAGKDTAASFLIDKLGYKNLKWAGGVKAMLAAALTHLGVPEERVDDYIEGNLKESECFLLSHKNLSDPEVHLSMVWALLEYQGVRNASALQNFVRVEELGYQSRWYALETLAEVWIPALFPARHNFFRRLSNLIRGAGFDTYTSPRRFMQTLGTEWGRDHMGKNFWVNITERLIRRSGKAVITDTRFKNEVEAVKALGGVVVKIHRAGLKADTSHSSESGVEDLPFDYRVINDYRSVAAFKRQLGQIWGTVLNTALHQN